MIKVQVLLSKYTNHKSYITLNDHAKAISAYGFAGYKLTNNNVVKDQPRQCRSCDFNEY